jgi:hypothetical protein
MEYAGQNRSTFQLYTQTRAIIIKNMMLEMKKKVWMGQCKSHIIPRGCRGINLARYFQTDKFKIKAIFLWPK